MNLDEFYDDLIEQDLSESEDTTELPRWVSSNNSSQAAYEAIQELVKKKRKYIRAHKAKSAYKSKSPYQMTKTEVAKEIGSGIKSQPLFNSNSYSKKLSDYFDDQNDLLHRAAEKRWSAPKGSHASKTKDELVLIVKEKSQTTKNLQEKSAAELMQLTLDKLTLDVKKKLGLL